MSWSGGSRGRSLPGKTGLGSRSCPWGLCVPENPGRAGSRSLCGGNTGRSMCERSGKTGRSGVPWNCGIDVMWCELSCPVWLVLGTCIPGTWTLGSPWTEKCLCEPCTCCACAGGGSCAGGGGTTGSRGGGCDWTNGTSCPLRDCCVPCLYSSGCLQSWLTWDWLFLEWLLWFCCCCCWQSLRCCCCWIFCGCSTCCCDCCCGCCSNIACCSWVGFTSLCVWFGSNRGCGAGGGTGRLRFGPS